MEAPLSPKADYTDRRTRVQVVLSSRGVPSQGDPDAAWAQEKFVTRARTLFYSRLAFLFIGLGLLAFPTWSEAFGIRGHMGFVVYFFMLGYSIANFLVMEHPLAGRWATFVTLCFDLCVVVYLIEASGGLHSPLFATQLMFTTLFVILFPKPLAVLPPLLTLPVVARVDQIIGHELGVMEVLILIWYSALNIIILFALVYLNEREETAHRDVVALERDLQGLAVVEERNRLSREIHDGLGASLSSLIIQAEYLQAMAKDEDLRREIQELKSCAEESIDELRRSLRMMRADFELVPAVEDYCRTFGDRSKIPVRFEREGVPRALSNEAQLAIFRVLQEALANASKHGKAKDIVVKLGFDEQRMALSITDDGVGFDTRLTPKGHYGLTNMHERAAKVGGEVQVTSEPGHGTQVTLLIPFASWEPRALTG